MSDCATCRHYKPREIRVDANGEPYGDWEVADEEAAEGEGWPSTKPDPAPWGVCKLARWGYEVMERKRSEERSYPTAEQAAAVQFFPSDAESYSAALYVRPAFGCKLWAEPETGA